MIERFLAIGAGASDAAPDPSWRGRGPRHAELHDLLCRMNGGVWFEGALHVFASGPGPRSLEAWNRDDLWRQAYGDLAAGLFFFAEAGRSASWLSCLGDRHGAMMSLG